MPRIYVVISRDEDGTVKETEPWDFCQDCFDDIKEQYGEDKEVTFERVRQHRARMIKFKAKDCEIDCDHPDYEETDYCCETCKKPLTSDDNWDD